MNELYTSLSWLPKPPSDFRTRCRQAANADRDVGRALRCLASYSLDQNQLGCVSNAITRLREAGRTLEPLVPFRLGLLSNSTVDFIVPALIATAVRHGIALEIISCGYDQAVQEALSPDSKINRARPDAVLLAFDFRAAALPDEAAEKISVQRTLGQIETIRSGIKENSGSICILQTIPPRPEALFGSLDAVAPGSPRRIVHEVNNGILARVSGSSDIVLDVAQLASTVGLANWYSPRDWNFAKLPFSDTYCPLYAEQICRVIGALRGKSRRCLVLDLDNTIWGGVIGDDGLEGIQLAEGDPTGEAYRCVQKMAVELRNRGIVLAVCSKNDDATARLPFHQHPEMLLRENHIAVFQANWQDKASNIRAIAQELSLGLESLVFVDDNPAERAIIRDLLPEVAVPELPEDPALYARTIAAAGYFESVSLSQEDIKRADFYQDNARRAQLKNQATNLEAYLRSLKMELSLRPFDETGRVRITQLINKSNQYNLTTRRYTEAQVAQMENDSKYFTLQARLSDVFGDNGMISVVICAEDITAEWRIDTWLMSCRVLGRQVENAILKEILDHAQQRGIRTLVGTYIPTTRNKLVEDHYPRLGFTKIREESDRSTVYRLEVGNASPDVPIKVHCLYCEGAAVRANA